jgi:plasmid maintenance system killer protein
MPKLAEDLRLKLITLIQDVDKIEDKAYAQEYTKFFILSQERKLQLLLAFFFKRNLKYIQSHTNKEILEQLNSNSWDKHGKKEKTTK